MKPEIGSIIDRINRFISSTQTKIVIINSLSSRDRAQIHEYYKQHNLLVVE